MANIGIVLKDEISRLARKELRSDSVQLKKTATHFRSEISALKRRVAELEKHLTRVSRRVVKGDDQDDLAEPQVRVRFTAKGLRSLRKRLDLSANDFGALIGVSGQSIYKWETESAHPRAKQVQALASIRGFGKKEAAARLRELGAVKS